MFKLIICVVVLLNMVPVFADFNSYPRIKPKYESYNSKKANIPIYNGSRRNSRIYPRYCPSCNIRNHYLSKSDLSALEKYALNKTYRRESDLARLERLENLAFGATQYGNLDNRLQNVETAILSRPQYKNKASVLSNLANYFSGQPTGFTPNILPYSVNDVYGTFNSTPYLFTNSPNNGFNRSNIEGYSNGPWSHSLGSSIENFGTGSSIRIID